jgi:peptide/nickel transport system ATP-binding protein
VVEAGSTEKVLNAPKHPYTRALLSVVPEMRQLAAVVLTGETPDPTAIPSGCRFHPRCPAYSDGTADAAGIAEACRAVPLEVLPSHGPHAAACHLYPPAGARGS